MSVSNLHKSSTDIYTEAESLIYNANNTSNNDINSKLALYLKAIDLLDQIQLSEKKEQFRNIYKQRMNEIKQQIKNIQLPLGDLISNPNPINKTSHDSISKNTNFDILAQKSQDIDLKTSFSLYPTLPDLSFDDDTQNQNSFVPIVNPTILNSNNSINQAQTQRNINFQEIPQTFCTPKTQTHDFSAKNQFTLTNNIYYPPFLPDFPEFQNDINILDYPMSIPVVQPQITTASYKPLSQPGPYSNSNNDYSNIKKYKSFSDSGEERLNTKSNTEIFKGNIMLASKDHVDLDQECNPKKCSSLAVHKKSDPNDSFKYPKYKMKDHNHKSPQFSKRSEPNVSDKIINIPENFKIESFLGHSTFGSIYLATEYSTHKKFVIRELKDFEGNNETSVSFFREVEALSKADHPAVLHLYGFSLLISKEKRYPAIVTEYMPGGTLLDIIKGKKLVTMTEKLILLYGICEAMHYLHDRLKIVHRDLKPKNILLNSNNEPIISDFGLSKVMSEQYMMKSQRAGSPKYTAPELLKDEEYSNKVDVYSYGIIAYELLTGKMAYYEATNIRELKSIVLAGKRPPLINEIKLHQVFKNLITACWDENEANRPSFYELALRFRQMEFVVDNCDKIQFRKYVRKCLNRT